MNSNYPFNIIFAGTPDFAAVTLAALIDSPHQILGVYTQPDRPAGRGQKVAPSPVKQLAEKHQLAIFQPTTLRDETEQQRLIQLNADLMIVVAYGLLLPKAILQAPRYGCINIHASLLPRWRGAAPIQRAILAGDSQTGVTIMQMDEGLDTGPIWAEAVCPIESDDTSLTLHDELAAIGAETLLHTLSQLLIGQPIPQQQANMTYAQKISKKEAELDWNLPAIALDRQIRAFNPWPIAFTHSEETVLRIFEATVMDATHANSKPGEIVAASSSGIDVQTGEKVLRLLKIQLPGGRVLAVSDILNSRREAFSPGKCLG